MCMDQCLWVLDAFMSNHNLLATSFRPICIYNGITGLAAAVFASVFMRVHTHVCVCVCVCVCSCMCMCEWVLVGIRHLQPLLAKPFRPVPSRMFKNCLIPVPDISHMSQASCWLTDC